MILVDTKLIRTHEQLPRVEHPWRDLVAKIPKFLTCDTELWMPTIAPVWMLENLAKWVVGSMRLMYFVKYFIISVVQSAPVANYNILPALFIVLRTKSDRHNLRRHQAVVLPGVLACLSSVGVDHYSILHWCMFSDSPCPKKLKRLASSVDIV